MTGEEAEFNRLNATLRVCSDRDALKKPKGFRSPGVADTTSRPEAVFSRMVACHSLLYTSQLRRALTKLSSVDTQMLCEMSRSQSSEESTYMRHFMPNRTGTFVEIGALDGHQFSNTRVLNICRGWNGLLIEGNSNNFARLITRLDRRNVKLVHSAVCEPPETWTNFSIDGGPVAVDTSRVSANFQKHWAKFNHPKRTQRVSCAPMSTLLDGLTHVDFFSLDVEGAEFTVVNTIDFEKTCIDTFCIELDGHDAEKDERVTKLLENKGYRRCIMRSGKHNGWFRKSC